MVGGVRKGVGEGGGLGISPGCNVDTRANGSANTIL